MMDDYVLIPYGKSASDTATLLLSAAEDQGYEPTVVRHQPDDGGFRVPEDVASAAGLGEPDEPQAPADAADPELEQDKAEAEAPKPRKRTAKKAAAKKTTTPAKG